jgi:hypothetical protein
MAAVQPEPWLRALITTTTTTNNNNNNKNNNNNNLTNQFFRYISRTSIMTVFDYISRFFCATSDFFGN